MFSRCGLLLHGIFHIFCSKIGVCQVLEVGFTLTFLLPWVTKTEFLITISVPYHVDKWWELKILNMGLLIDPIPNSPN